MLIAKVREPEGSLTVVIFIAIRCQGTESYKDRLNSHMHMFTNTPNMKMITLVALNGRGNGMIWVRKQRC